MDLIQYLIRLCQARWLFAFHSALDQKLRVSGFPLQAAAGAPGSRSIARKRASGRPEDVLFNAWYPSRRLLKRIRDYGWYVVCRLKKNRRFNGQALRTYRRHPYWVERGWLTGGLKVLVVRYGAKYDATNRLTLAAPELRRLYAFRAQIEEAIRVCKDQLGLTGCQARSERAQLHHMACCLTAFCVPEHERHERNLSIYKLKRLLSVRGRLVTLPDLERLRSAA
jgi:DDE family transposase